MEKKEKSLNLKVYAVVAFFAVAVMLTLIVVFTFKSKYPAFHPDEVARNYADTIVQTGDGYNAYKNSLLSKNCKYGNYIRKYFMNPVIYSETSYKPGDDTKELKGFNDESYMGEKTKSDDGSLQGQVIEIMYGHYKSLLEDIGWDNYETMFSQYFELLCEVREQIFGDKYMTDDIMFTALESNVRQYGEFLTGTEDEFDKNTGNQTSVKTVGAYQTAYGEDYRFTAFVQAEKEVDLAAYKDNGNSDMLETYGVDKDDIAEAKCYTISVKTDNDAVVTSADVTVVRIGNSWYVDSAETDTTALYGFYN